MGNEPYEHLLVQISSDSLRQKLKGAIHQHTAALRRELTALQTVHADLKDRLLDKCAQYEKAVREARFYREKYQKLPMRHCKRYSYDDEESVIDPQLRLGNLSLATSLSPASDEENDYYSARSFSSRSSFNNNNLSSSSSNHASVQSQLETDVDDPIDLVAIIAASEEQQQQEEDHIEGLEDDQRPCLYIEAMMIPPPEHPPPPPPSSPLLVQKELHCHFSAEIATRRLEGLIYACNEGFWNTIARGKSHKEEVYQLVSSYFRRGGQPNVAKNSPSLKSVKEGYGLLHAVVAIKNSKTVSRVLDAGANPNAVALGPKKEDCTVPLVLAAQIGYLRGVRLLVERGKADLFQRGPQQITALHAAVMHDSMETVQYLLQVSQNALLDSVDVDGATPLHAACGYGRTRIVTFFLKECQAKSDAQNHKGETPLHYAVKRRQYKTVCRLVGSLGAYPNPYVANQTPTPLDLARSCGFKAIADYLRKMGAKTTKEMEKTAALRRSSWQSRDLNSSSTNSSTTSAMTASIIGGASIASGRSGETSSSLVSSSGSSVASFLARSSSRKSRGSFGSFI